MKHKRQNLPEFLDRSFASFRTLPTSQIEAACNRVLDRLHEEDRAPQAAGSEPIPERFQWRWVAVAAFAAVLLVVVLIPWRTGVRVDRNTAVASNAPQAINAGSETVLADGSRLEASPQSEVSVTSLDNGVLISLKKGAVIVSAAKQAAGLHLQVQTKDLTVSVVGTVFLVGVEEAGSRVAVIEGEVRVNRGSKETSLHSGEQITTNPMMESHPIEEELSWSRGAAARRALLMETRKQGVSASEAAKPSRISFEVASIKPTPPSETENGSMTMFPPGGFRRTNATLKDLVQSAYGLQTFQVSGAPAWATKERFNIDAKAGGNVSRNQILLMIQDLLAERFKLRVRRTKEQISVYALVPVKSGAKLKAVPDSESAPVSARINGYTGKKTIARFAEYLSGIVGQTVVDRTGLSGVYDIQLAFTPESLRERFGDNLDDPSLTTALQDQLGLKLEASKAPVEYLVIESVERPSPN